MNKQNQLAGIRMWHQIIFSIALLLGASAQAQTAIEAVSGSIQGGLEVVRIDLSQALTAVPSGFLIQSPARIALDFPGVTSAMGRSNVELSQGNVNSVSVVQAGERTRVVLNLKYPVAYTAEIQGKSLMVVLEAVAPRGPTAKAASTFAEDRSRNTAPLRDIDFRRSATGVGRVVVTLPNNQVGVDIRQDGPKLVVDFMKSTLPEGLRRRLDVADFGTPVKSITTTESGERVRMVIEAKGLWEHIAYQSDEQLVIEVKEIKSDPTKLTDGVGYNGQKLSLNFQSIEVRSLLQVIADFTNFNIVTSDTVSGSVTLRLQDVPWDQALDIILESKGLDKRKNGNVIWIAPKAEMADTTKFNRLLDAERDKGEKVVDKIYQLRYALAGPIVAILNATHSGVSTSTSASGAKVSSSDNSYSGSRDSSYESSYDNRILSPKGSAAAEPRTNKVYVKDVPSRIDYITRMIDEFDIPIRQVLIEARIVEASDTFGKSLGVKLGAIDARAQKGGDGGYQLSGDNRVAFGTSYENAVASSGAGGAVSTSGNFVNLPAIGQNGLSPATFALSVFSATANRFLNLEISALEADGKGKVVSSPRVVTANFVSAMIEQGTELPYQIASASGATAIAFRKANLKLEVKPQITPEGSVVLELDITKDTVGQSTSAGFAINTKHVKTQVLVENGGTVMIGGIFEETLSENETKVPFLGDLPGLGYLFKTKGNVSNKQEMLIFITPRMMAEASLVR